MLCKIPEGETSKGYDNIPRNKENMPERQSHKTNIIHQCLNMS